MYSCIIEWKQIVKLLSCLKNSLEIPAPRSLHVYLNVFESNVWQFVQPPSVDFKCVELVAFTLNKAATARL